MAVFCLLAATDQPEKAPQVVHRLPALSSAFPQGARAGETVELEILGQHLDRSSDLLFTHSSLSGAIIDVKPTRLRLRVQTSADTPYGYHYFRIVSPRGASNLIPFRIGDQPHHNEREPNSTIGTAEPVSVPVTINAQLPMDADFDFYRFHASAGETLIFDLRAARNGSSLDAALILLDARGRKLEHVEDTFIWDPFFAYNFREAGDYLAVIQPTSARNDPGFAYQLDIRRAAHLQTLSPISLRPGVETEVTLFGQGLGDSKARLYFVDSGFSGTLVQARGETAIARIRVPAGAKTGVHEMRLASAGLSNPLTFLVDATPAHPSGLLQPPVSMNGVVRYRQPERFRFQADAGQTLVFEVRAHRFGSPVDSVLRILDAKGKAVATNDDGNFPGAVFNKDARLSHKFKETGEYEIEIRNLTAVTGENFPYQLVIHPPRPKVELMLATDQPYLYPGEPRRWKVIAVRTDGHKGEIPLSVHGLPPGVLAKPAVIPADKNDVEIELTAPEAKPGTFARVDVTATDAEAPAWRAVQASSGGGEGRHYGRAQGAVLAVAEKPLFSLECASTNVNLVRNAGAEVKVMIRRRPGFTEKLDFRAENLPAGVTLETIDSGADLAVLRFRAAEDVQPGRAARVSILGTAPAAGQSHEAPRISLLVD